MGEIEEAGKIPGLFTFRDHLLGSCLRAPGSPSA
jgi:hypothetical protein